MIYNRCGNSGLKLPALSLGLWHNFGHVDCFETSREMACLAFEQGITHFDLANNYGPPAGSAEENFGRILRSDFVSRRDELIISSKAGYHMWDGPYGEWGSRKHIMASIDQSLARLGLDYVDIFYSHRFDPETPLEETMKALADIIQQGKALYVGVSNYDASQTKKAKEILDSYGIHLLINQPGYSMLNRTHEDNGLFDELERLQMGSICFSPLAQGLLTEKYLKGIPDDSRAAKIHGFLQKEQVTPAIIKKVAKLNEIAKTRNQSLAAMALAWILNKKSVVSVLIGAGRPEHIIENIKTLDKLDFTEKELSAIETILVTVDG